MQCKNNEDGAVNKNIHDNFLRGNGVKRRQITIHVVMFNFEKAKRKDTFHHPEKFCRIIIVTIFIKSKESCMFLAGIYFFKVNYVNTNDGNCGTMREICSN